MVEEVEKNNVGNAGGIRDLKCLGERMLHAKDALLIGKSGQEIIEKKQRSYGKIIIQKIGMRYMKKESA